MNMSRSSRLSRFLVVAGLAAVLLSFGPLPARSQDTIHVTITSLVMKPVLALRLTLVFGP
jgi:hypothetical protein